MKKITLRSIIKKNGGKKQFIERLTSAIELSNNFYGNSGDDNSISWQSYGCSFACGCAPAIYLNGNNFISLLEMGEDCENAGIYCSGWEYEGEWGEIVDCVDYDTAEKLLEEIYDFMVENLSE